MFHVSLGVQTCTILYPILRKKTARFSDRWSLIRGFRSRQYGCWLDTTIFSTKSIWGWDGCWWALNYDQNCGLGWTKHERKSSAAGFWQILLTFLMERYQPWKNWQESLTNVWHHPIQTMGQGSSNMQRPRGFSSTFAELAVVWLHVHTPVCTVS